MYAPPPPEAPPTGGYGGTARPPRGKPGYGTTPATGYGSEPDPYATGEDLPEGGDYDETSQPDEGGDYGSATTPEETGYGSTAGEDTPPEDDSYSSGGGGGGGGSSGYGGGGGGSSDDGSDGGEGPSSEGEDELRRRVADAQSKLRDAEAKLVKHQERAKLLESISKMVDDYETEYPALEALDKKLRDYRKAEETCLVQILEHECVSTRELREEVKRLRAAIERLKASVAEQERILENCRKSLETAKTKAAEAKVAFDALLKPAASVAARLKAVEAFRAEVAAAHNGSENAVAYWLLTDAEKLDGKLNGEPRLYLPDQLGHAIDRAGATSADARHKVDKIEADIKAKEQTLKADKAELADRIKTLDERIRRRLNEIESRPAEAA
jgi:hypothetical protein